MNNSQILLNVNWEKYFDPNNTVLNQYLQYYGDAFLIGVLSDIEEALKNNSPFVILISFTGSDIISMVKKSEYPLVLHKLLRLCEHLEKYELCNEIVRVQKKFYTEKCVIPKNLKEHVSTIIVKQT